MNRLLLIITLCLAYSNSYAQKDTSSLERIDLISPTLFSTKTTVPKVKFNLISNPHKVFFSNPHKVFFKIDSSSLVHNAILRIPNLTFPPGLYTIEYGYSDLDKLVILLKKHKTVKIEIRGHICCKTNGEDAYNTVTGHKNLSVQRAKEVYNYLEKKGINKNRMRYIGFGSLMKIMPNDLFDREAAKVNRRVDIKIIEE